MEGCYSKIIHPEAFEFETKIGPSYQHSTTYSFYPPYERGEEREGK